MKQLLTIGAGLMCGLMACTPKEQFVIEGTLEGKPDGKVYVVTYEWNKKPDTVAWAEVSNGRFTLTGKVPDTTEAGLYVAAEKAYTIFLLQNADYKAHIDLNDAARNRVEGTDLQHIFLQYSAISQKTDKQKGELRKRYMEARQSGNAAVIDECMEAMDRIMQKEDRERKEFVEAYQDNYFGAYILNKSMYAYSDMEELQRAYDRLGATAKTVKPARMVAERLREMEAFAPGKVAPDFRLPTPEGDSLSMYEVEGKVKILDFWASWCGPCRAENPAMVKLFEKYRDRGLNILSISIDHQPEAWIKAIAEDRLPWNHVMDARAVAYDLFKLKSGIPHVIVLDENNRILANGIRGEKLEKKIEALLQ